MQSAPNAAHAAAIRPNPGVRTQPTSSSRCVPKARGRRSTTTHSCSNVKPGNEFDREHPCLPPPGPPAPAPLRAAKSRQTRCPAHGLGRRSDPSSSFVLPQTGNASTATPPSPPPRGFWKGRSPPTGNTSTATVSTFTLHVAPRDRAPLGCDLHRLRRLPHPRPSAKSARSAVPRGVGRLRVLRRGVETTRSRRAKRQSTNSNVTHELGSLANGNSWPTTAKRSPSSASRSRK
jgi:hypothetical protein